MLLKTFFFFSIFRLATSIKFKYYYYTILKGNHLERKEIHPILLFFLIPDSVYSYMMTHKTEKLANCNKKIRFRDFLEYFLNSLKIKELN